MESNQILTELQQLKKLIMENREAIMFLESNKADKSFVDNILSQAIVTKENN